MAVTRRGETKGQEATKETKAKETNERTRPETRADKRDDKRKGKERMHVGTLRVCALRARQNARATGSSKCERWSGALEARTGGPGG